MTDRATKPIWIDGQKKGLKMGFGGGVDEVKTNLRSTGYPEANVHFIVGDVVSLRPDCPAWRFDRRRLWLVPWRTASDRRVLSRQAIQAAAEPN
jgi:hypothetical protein